MRKKKTKVKKKIKKLIRSRKAKSNSIKKKICKKAKNKNTKKKKIRLLTRGDSKALAKFKKKTKLQGDGGELRRSSNQASLFDNLINVETTAEVLGVAPKTVRKWICVRYIPYVKIGRRVMFRPKSLELWLNRKETKSWL